MTERHLSIEIARLWPKLDDTVIAMIWQAVRKLSIDDDQATAALNAEFFRPPNKIPAHQRIVNCLKAAVQTRTERSGPPVEESDDARAFRLMRAAWNIPPEVPAERAVWMMAAHTAKRQTAVYGAPTFETIRQTEQDYARFTTLEPIDIEAELADLFGDAAMTAYYERRRAIRERMQQRRVTERDIVKSAHFTTSSEQDRRKMLVEGLVHAPANGGEE